MIKNQNLNLVIIFKGEISEKKFLKLLLMKDIVYKIILIIVLLKQIQIKNYKLFIMEMILMIMLK